MERKALKYNNNEVACLDVPNRIKWYFGPAHEDRVLYEVEGLGYIIKSKLDEDCFIFLSESYIGTDLEGMIKLKEIADEL